LRLEPHVKGFSTRATSRRRREYRPAIAAGTFRRCGLRRISSSKASSMETAYTGPLPGEMKSMLAALSQTM
jgi:hypothetical protein